MKCCGLLRFTKNAKGLSTWSCKENVEKLSSDIPLCIRLRTTVPCTAPGEDQGHKFSIPSWFSCLPSQPAFLGPAHAFHSQVKPALLLSCREVRTPLLSCSSRRGGPSWPLAAQVMAEWVATALSWPHKRSERGQSERTSAVHTWSNKTPSVLFFPICVQTRAGKGLFNFYCSHIDVPAVGKSHRPKRVLLSKY